MLLLLSVMSCQITSAQNAHQDISAKIDVSTSQINVTNQINLPTDFLGGKDVAYFFLNKNLTVESVQGGKIEKVENPDDNKSYVDKYKLDLKKSSKNTFTIIYNGVINDKIEQSAAEYARGFSETTGMISDNGVYLANSSYWIPTFSGDLLSTFKLSVEIDKEWSVVSQGTRTQNEVVDNKKLITYNSPDLMDEVYLTAAKWTEYSKQLGEVEVQAFLRTADEKLAQQYLGITSGYLEMYETLIGKYPYTKFALVENFWETGYGMPSFTLLGEKVIRFPWILYSSYPHELLHNYWGNSVFVNYSEGNWCEGITAYMADHLLQEQRGSGASYRRNTLQKFSDYVNVENDFPINKFLNRNNSAEEAIGYGKVLMVNDMLRTDLGDEVFVKSYQKFYNDNTFKKASFPEIQKSFEEVSGKNLDAFFKQWINRKGAPELELKDVSTNGNQLSFTIKQIQSEAVFNLNVPIAVYVEGNDQVVWGSFEMNQKEQEYILELDSKPLRMEVDPQFNLMRRLDRNEVPASLSQVYGETKMTLIIPSESAYKEAYKKMAEIWKSTQEAQGKTAEILIDIEIEAIPKDNAVWVLGYENKFYGKELQKHYSDHLNAENLNQINALEASGSLVFAIPNIHNAEHSIGFVGGNSDAAIAALTRKLPHYGKYGYLGFEDDEAKNVMKGSLPALDSPLAIKINDGEIKAKIAPRNALFQPKQKAGRPTH